MDSDGSEIVSLADLPIGGAGVICEVDDTGPLGQRLLDLGFVPRTRVRLVRRAPMGDPLQLELRGTRICLRRRDVERVKVRSSD